jgi:hypothetical protein
MSGMRSTVKETNLSCLERPTPRHQPHMPESKGNKVRFIPPQGVRSRTSSSSVSYTPNSEKNWNNYNSFDTFSSRKQQTEPSNGEHVPSHVTFTVVS